MSESNTTAIASSWQDELRHAIRDGASLLRELGLPQTLLGTGPLARQFPVFAPPSYVRRIRPADPGDPLLRQILPVPGEDRAGDAIADPLQESQFAMGDGLLQKYERRALLVVNGRCAIHCRYCFRRHFPYEASPQATGRWDKIAQAIEEASDIHEIILSGGDPLTMSDTALERLLDMLSGLPNLRRIRIHTRLPVVIPARVSSQLLEILGPREKSMTVVVHCNHPQELDSTTQQAIHQMLRAGIPVLNQSVLLAGINDRLETLRELSERLFECGALPYYLHQLDPVRGATHFHVPIERGVALITALRNSISGYLVPRYVQEIPGRLSKTILA